MKSLDEKIAELTKQHDKEVAAAQNHERLGDFFPILKTADFYHDSPLYGRKATIAFDVDSISKALEILRELKDVKLAPLYLVRDGCVSHKTVLTEKDQKAEVTPIAPIIYKIDSFKTGIEVYVEIDGEFYEIELRSKFNSNPFHGLIWRHLRYKGDRAIDCSLHYSSDFMERQIAYWSSDIDTKGYSTYTTNLGIGIAELIAELERVSR